jgi:hypothetical protein
MLRSVLLQYNEMSLANLVTPQLPNNKNFDLYKKTAISHSL